MADAFALWPNPSFFNLPFPFNQLCCLQVDKMLIFPYSIDKINYLRDGWAVGSKKSSCLQGLCAIFNCIPRLRNIQGYYINVFFVNFLVDVLIFDLDIFQTQKVYVGLDNLNEVFPYLISYDFFCDARNKTGQSS